MMYVGRSILTAPGFRRRVVHGPDRRPLAEVTQVIRQREVALVGARDTAESTIPLLDIHQLVRKDGETVPHCVVGVAVVHRRVKLHAPRAVDDSTNSRVSALTVRPHRVARGDHERHVPRLPPPSPEHRIQMPDQPFWDQQLTKRIAVRVRPLAHSSKLVGIRGPSKCPVVDKPADITKPIPVRIECGIKGCDLASR